MAATPQQYLNMFQGHADGAAILEDLMAVHYDGEIWVRGDTEATFINIGARKVVSRILAKMADAQKGDEEQQT